jgi:ribosomal protein S18 acetylase RimI-like enzyme
MFFVKKMKPEDFPFAVDLANTLDWKMGVSDFEFNSQLEPEGCLVLFDDLERIGIATCINYGKVGWFGNLAVKETYRKRGAGTLLVKSAANYLKAKGVTTIGLYAYPHLVNFYGKIGFKPDVEFEVLQADSVLAPLFPNKEENLKLTDAKDISRIVNLDAKCFGASRRESLESLLKEKNNFCYVVLKGGELTGYIVAKVYDGVAEVGPLVCQRNPNGIAKSLLTAVLSRLQGSEVYLYVPKAETSLIDVAVKAGFKNKFGLVRMFLGPIAAEDCVYIAESLERG